jgi:Calcium-dependent channel, 7TM region, putative phosphate
LPQVNKITSIPVIGSIAQFPVIDALLTAVLPGMAKNLHNHSCIADCGLLQCRATPIGAQGDAEVVNCVHTWPGLVLRVFLLILPSLLAFMNSFQGFISLSQIDFNVVRKFFIFQVTRPSSMHAFSVGTANTSISFKVVFWHLFHAL